MKQIITASFFLLLCARVSGDEIISYEIVPYHSPIPFVTQEQFFSMCPGTEGMTRAFSDTVLGFLAKGQPVVLEESSINIERFVKNNLRSGVNGFFIDFSTSPDSCSVTDSRVSCDISEKHVFFGPVPGTQYFSSVFYDEFVAALRVHFQSSYPSNDFDSNLSYFLSCFQTVASSNVVEIGGLGFFNIPSKERCPYCLKYSNNIVDPSSSVRYGNRQMPIGDFRPPEGTLVYQEPTEKDGTSVVIPNGYAVGDCVFHNNVASCVMNEGIPGVFIVDTRWVYKCPFKIRVKPESGFINYQIKPYDDNESTNKPTYSFPYNFTVEYGPINQSYCGIYGIYASSRGQPLGLSGCGYAWVSACAGDGGIGLEICNPTLYDESGSPGVEVIYGSEVCGAEWNNFSDPLEYAYKMGSEWYKSLLGDEYDFFGADIATIEKTGSYYDETKPSTRSLSLTTYEIEAAGNRDAVADADAFYNEILELVSDRLQQQELRPEIDFYDLSKAVIEGTINMMKDVSGFDPAVGLKLEYAGLESPDPYDMQVSAVSGVANAVMVVAEVPFELGERTIKVVASSSGVGTEEEDLLFKYIIAGYDELEASAHAAEEAALNSLIIDSAYSLGTVFTPAEWASVLAKARAATKGAFTVLNEELSKKAVPYTSNLFYGNARKPDILEFVTLPYHSEFDEYGTPTLSLESLIFAFDESNSNILDAQKKFYELEDYAKQQSNKITFFYQMTKLSSAVFGEGYVSRYFKNNYDLMLEELKTNDSHFRYLHSLAVDARKEAYRKAQELSFEAYKAGLPNPFSRDYSEWSKFASRETFLRNGFPSHQEEIGSVTAGYLEIPGQLDSMFLSSFEPPADLLVANRYLYNEYIRKSGDLRLSYEEAIYSTPFPLLPEISSTPLFKVKNRGDVNAFFSLPVTTQQSILDKLNFLGRAPDSLRESPLLIEIFGDASLYFAAIDDFDDSLVTYKVEMNKALREVASKFKGIKQEVDNASVLIEESRRRYAEILQMPDVTPYMINLYRSDYERTRHSFDTLFAYNMIFINDVKGILEKYAEAKFKYDTVLESRKESVEFLNSNGFNINPALKQPRYSDGSSSYRPEDIDDYFYQLPADVREEIKKPIYTLRGSNVQIASLNGASVKMGLFANAFDCVGCLVVTKDGDSAANHIATIVSKAYKIPKYVVPENPSDWPKLGLGVALFQQEVATAVSDILVVTGSLSKGITQPAVRQSVQDYLSLNRNVYFFNIDNGVSFPVHSINEID